MDTDASAAWAALKDLVDEAKAAQRNVYRAVADTPAAPAGMSFEVGRALGSPGNAIGRASASLAAGSSDPSASAGNEPDALAGF